MPPSALQLQSAGRHLGHQFLKPNRLIDVIHSGRNNLRNMNVTQFLHPQEGDRI